MLKDVFIVTIGRLSILKEMTLNTCQCWKRCVKDDSKCVFAPTFPPGASCEVFEMGKDVFGK